MKIIKLIIFSSVFLMISCKGKTQEIDLLSGKWKSYKTEFRNGRDTSASGKKFAADAKWEFTKDGYFFNIDISSDEKIPFTLISDTIYYGPKSVYYVEKLSSNELIVISINSSGTESITDTRQYFKKVKSFDEKVEGP